MGVLSKSGSNAMVSIVLALLIITLLAMTKSSSAQTSSQDCLPPHNSARAAVGVASLSWNTTLVMFAQNYANQRKADCMLVHSGGPYGENLARSSGDLSCSAAGSLWVSEKADYNYNTNSCAPNKVCGHYTQVVWRNTTQVGCARVRCDSNRGTFVICSYSPPGNYIGQRPY